MRLGRVIARRKLTRGRGSRATATVEIGEPRRTGRHEYCCPFRVTGIGDDKVRAAYGVDATQAMQLVSQAIAAQLFRHPDLRWLGQKDKGFPPADRSLPLEWARAIHQTATAPPGEPDAPPLWPPIELLVDASAPIRCFFFTKVWLPRVWLRAGKYPKRTDAIVHYGIPSPRHCAILRAHARVTGNALQFAGDLDPLDLTVFASLEAGGAPLRSRPLPAVPVVYCGIDDDWLEMSEKHLLDGNLANVLIRQDAVERKLLKALERAGADVERLVGPRCARLLRDGLKLEIEGATHAALYGRGFTAKVLRRLLRPASRAGASWRRRK